MKKILISVIAMLVTSIALARWDTGESFPNPNENTLTRGSHGIAVDGNGRIWYGAMFVSDSIYVSTLNGLPTKKCTDR